MQPQRVNCHYLTCTDISVVKGAGIQATYEGLGLVKVGTAEFANLILPEADAKSMANRQYRCD